MRVTFRPLPAWPYPEQPQRPATYKVSYDRTLRDLDYEIDRVNGHDVVIGLVASDRDVRMDGMLRADAKVLHPGVELSFEKDGQRLIFHTDVHKGYRASWQDNLRAIALGLEALRAVDRYGISQGIGQQYAGFAVLTAGPSELDLGRELVERYGGVTEALRATHPDTGNGSHSSREFGAVMAYKKALVPA